MKKAIFFIAFCAATVSASAQSTIETERAAWLPNTVGLHLVSTHSAPGYNNANHGIFVRWADESGQGAGIGIIRNSHSMTSVWAGYSFTTPSITAAKLRGELTLGVISNYPKCEICPLVQIGGSAAIGSQARVHLGWSPKPRPDAASVTHLSTSWSF